MIAAQNILVLLVLVGWIVCALAWAAQDRSES